MRAHPGGPGGGDNLWSDSPQSVWVDSLGRLHLKLRQEDGVWKSAEVYSMNTTRHGRHRFLVEGPLAELDRNVRVGLFLYAPTGQELDIEFATWSENVACQNASFSIHPAPVPLDPCQPTLAYHPFQLIQGGTSTHIIDWRESVVTFRSTGYFDPGTGRDIAFVQERTFRESRLKFPSETAGMRIHINVWLSAEAPREPAAGREVEIIIVDVETPANAEQMASRETERITCPQADCPACNPIEGVDER